MPMPPMLEGKAVNIMDQPNRGKGAGRKPKLIRKWIKAANISKADAQAILLDLLSSYTPAQLNDMRKSEYDSISALTYIFLGHAMAAVQKNDFSITKQMLEFIFGNDPQAQVNITNNTQLVDLKTVILQKANASPEERERIISELEKITGYQE
jgi:hypothetical protein